MGNEEKKIILFDGVCNLCDGVVNFIIKRDKKDIFRYASLQSEVGQKLTKENGIDTSKMDTFILIESNTKYSLKSTAALRIARQLSGGYPLLSIFLIIPIPIRNWIYDIISKNRYKWFGKTDQCWIPTPELQSRFI